MFLKSFAFIFCIVCVSYTAAMDATTSEKDYYNTLLKAYNDHYGTNFQTATEIETDQKTRTKAFYSNVRECKAGSYDFPFMMPNGLIVNLGTINPEQNYCNVDVLTTYVNGTTAEVKCQYQKSDLALYTDGILDGADQANAQAIQKIQMGEQCKIYSNGALQGATK